MLAVMAAVWGLTGSLLDLQAAQYGPIEVSVEPLPVGEGGGVEFRSGGYIEYRITIRNSSQTQDFQVRLVAPSEKNGYGDFLMRNSRTVQVPHQGTLVVSLFQPAIRTFDRQMLVELDGRRQEERISLPEPLGSSGGGWGGGSGMSPQYAVLASRRISQDFKDQVRSTPATLTAFYRSEIDTRAWSPNWLGYTAYNGILITKTEADELPADVALGLRRYVESGGSLLIQGIGNDPQRLVPESLRGSAVLDENGFYRVGFGRMLGITSIGAWAETLIGMRLPEGTASSDPGLFVPMESHVPVRGLLGLVILFAVVIGPFNIWILTRQRRRMWLWWNVPLFSFVTCLAIFSYSLLAEGIRGRGRSSMLTLLDEQAHRATSWGYLSYYCPLTPSGGLHFSPDTAVTALSSIVQRNPWDRGNERRPRTIDWTTDQHLDSGWIVPRVGERFFIRKNETRRERLAFRTNADGTVTVVNGLGTEVTALTYRDASGKLFQATDMAPGQEQQMVPFTEGERSSEEPEASLQLLASHANAGSFQQVKSNPARYLVPSSYLAVVDRSPFLENPLPGAPEAGSLGLIYGLNAGGDNGN